MTQLVMATLTAPDDPIPEAEPVTLELHGEALTLTAEDGTQTTFALDEFMRAIDAEQAPGERAVA